MQLITSLLIAQGLLFQVNKPVPVFDYKPVAPVIEVVRPEPVVYTPPAPAPVISYPNQSTNDYKLFIYMKESGNNPAAVNSTGCRGLGQACPGSKLPCGNDYACQDAYFTNYAISRYGSWYNAYLFWLSHNWW